MKSFSEILKRFTALLLCLLMLAAAPAAFAEETPVPEEAEDESIIDSDELQGLVDEYIKSHGLNGDFISLGFCYTETGDSWYYNPDEWYYSASIYKVPLFMIMAEREYNGEYTQDSDINGAKLSDIEDMVLINSNNYYAHHVMNYIGGSPVETMESNRVARELYRNYANLPEDYYVDNFYDYSYFTARFMTEVMQTLYFENERFPGIVDRLKQAQPNGYFNKKLDGRYEVAQKYGALNDVNGTPFNHTTGIIYMPHPVILTVMTKNMGLSDETIADFALLFEEYTLSLDSRLEQYEREKAEAERLRAEEEKRQTQEAERLEQERIAEQQRKAQEEAERLEQERIEAEKAVRREKLIKISIFAGSGAVILLIVLLIAVKCSKKTPKAPKPERKAVSKAPAKAAREEKASLSSKRRQADHYKPKH